MSKSPASEEQEQAELEETGIADKPTPERKQGWLVPVVAVAGIVAICCLLAVIAAAAAAVLTGEPADVAKPARAELIIIEPFDKAILDTRAPISVSGTGAGLPDGRLVVQILDEEGIARAQELTTLQGPGAATGGQGTWSVELTLESLGPWPGQIVAYAPPSGGEPVASDAIYVAFGEVVDLEGPTWVLNNTIEGTEITATFEDGKVSGSAGCNSYSGTYESTRAAYNSTITISELAVTQMMCEEDVMAQETKYLAALGSASTYGSLSNILVIAHPGGTLVFHDQAGPPPGP